MTGFATVVCLILALITAAIGAVLSLRNYALTKVALIAAAVTELAVLVYTGLRVADLIGGHHTSGLVVVLAYLVGLLLVMPVATALGYAEPSRWGGVVLASGALVTCVMFARINQLWSPHG